MEFPFFFLSQNESDTISLSKLFSSEIKDGMIISLNGDLGSGKTFFIKNLLSGFNINNVSSPTFAIVNEYDGEKKFYHFDFYRINKESELIDIGITDYFNDTDAICLIEWAELFPEIIPSKRFEIQITFTEENFRLFTIKKYE